jgi:hypothetical protein
MVGSLDGGAHYRHHLISTNVRFDPTQKAMLRRSEGPQSAFHVEMCMAQHLLLSAFGIYRHERPFEKPTPKPPLAIPSEPDRVYRRA